MADKINAADFWIDRGLEFIVPKEGATEWPEGFNVTGLLPQWIGNKVVEVGCGTGRLAPAFENYIGYDINPAALEVARARCPQHTFELMPETVRAETVLVYTVLLHIPDDELAGFLGRIKCKRLMICEIMHPKHRKPFVEGEVPAFNRWRQEYELFGRPLRWENYHYKYYPGEVITWLLMDMT